MTHRVPPIAVVGSGVVGLTAALELAAREVKVTVYSDASAHPSASRAAPALFTPYGGPDEDRFRRWTEHSFMALARIAAEAGPESGVRMGELREYRTSARAERPWLDRLLDSREMRPVPAPFASAAASTRPHIDMLRYLPWMEARARATGVEFVTRSLRSLEEVFALGHRIVVNCAGLGARELAADPLVKAMHGQVLHVPNDIGLEYSIHDDAPGGVVAYVFAFGERLVLGGTFDAGREDQTTDRPTLDAIVGRCRNLLRLDGHPRWRDLARRETRALAGVRPARGPEGAYEHTRVERVDLGEGRAVVHNYGHGRAGATLSWATAAEAADLALGRAATP